MKKFIPITIFNLLLIGAFCSADVTEFLQDGREALRLAFVQIAAAQVSNGIQSIDFNESTRTGFAIKKYPGTNYYFLWCHGVVHWPIPYASAPEIEGLQICNSTSLSMGQRANGIWYETISLSPEEITKDTLQICSVSREFNRYIQDMVAYK